LCTSFSLQEGIHYYNEHHDEILLVLLDSPKTFLTNKIYLHVFNLFINLFSYLSDSLIKLLKQQSGIHSETMNIYWSTYKESSLVKYIWHNSILDKMENNEFQIILWIKNVIKGIMLNDKYSTPPHKVYWIKIASAIFCCFSNLIRESENVKCIWPAKIPYKWINIYSWFLNEFHSW
jgi:hypothetical protein